jgi:hypothetical protein
MRKILISLIVLAATFLIGTGAVLIGLFFISRSSSAVLPPTSAVTPIPPEQASGTPLPQRLDTPIPVNPSKTGSSDVPSTLSADLKAQMDEIQKQVIALRGLQPNKPVIRDLLTPAELKKKVETDFFKDYSAQDAKNDALVLSTLGLLPHNFDLMDLYTRLYTEQIAGYYDSETKEMYVVQGKAFGGIERMTYAHEYTHTLQDQNYDLRNGLKINNENCKKETEYCSAVTALLEGDASFTEQEWMLGKATQQDRKDIQDFYSSYSSPVFDSAPLYMQSDFLFPYKQGLEFVYSLKDRGGYTLVDGALKNPPVSTEQIMHPDKYPADKPIAITLPDLSNISSGGWKQVEQNVLGEWYSYLVLADGQDSHYRLPEDSSRNAAAGWGGDRYALYLRQSDNAVMFVLQSRWDSEKDAGEFFTQMAQYGQDRWGSPAVTKTGQFIWNQTTDGTVTFGKQGTDTLWVIAPDEAARNAVLAQFPAFQLH